MWKHLLISPFALLLLWTFQISNYTIIISNFSKLLMILSLEATIKLLKIWLLLMIVSTTSAIIGMLVFSRRYKMPIIFKYNFNCGNQGVLTLSELIWLVFFTYLSIVCKSRDTVTLLVMIVIPAWSIHTKLAMTSNLMFFNALLRLTICLLKDSINLVLFLLLIGMITCFWMVSLLSYSLWALVSQYY